MRILKKISKGFLKFILFTVFLVTVCYILFRSRPFQNYAAQKAVNYLSSELGTSVSLKSIDLQLLNTLVLKGLCVKDLQGDTLGYFGSLKVNFNYRMVFDDDLQLARIKKVAILNSKINLIQHRGEDDFNYQFLIDYFSPPRKSTGKHIPFKLFITSVELDNVDFRFRVEDDPKVEGRRFDESDMEFKNIRAVLFPFKLVDDSLNFDVRHMSFTEKSGLKVLDFSAKTIISGTKMEFSELALTTPNSSLGNYLKFSYNSYNELSDFVEKVNWTTYLSKSRVSMRDIAFFSDELTKYDFPIFIEGKAKGTLMRLYGKRLDLKIGDLNRFQGDFVLTDLTDTDLMGFDLKMNNLLANPSSLQQIFSMPMPEELLRIGSIAYNGNLKGTFTNFKLKGLIETTIGKIRTDLNLKFPFDKPEQYKGEIEVFSLNMGTLLNTAGMGNLSLLAEVDGSGFTLDELNSKLRGNVRQFEYDGYDYKDISMDGVFEKKQFSGLLDIKDPNVNFSLNGKFDLNKEIPTGDFKANIGVVNLTTLGYGDINIKEISNIDINFTGKDIDNLNVEAVLKNIVLEKNDTVYQAGNVYLDAFGQDNDRSVSLVSDIGNVNIKGQFKLSKLQSIIDNILYDLFPDYYAYLGKKTEPVDLRFEVDIVSSRLITALFAPDLSFSGFTASGIYNSVNQNMDIVSRAESFKYLDYTFREIKLESLKVPRERLTLQTKVGQFLMSDSLITDKLDLSANIGGNDINFNLNISDTTHDLSLKSSGNVIFSKKAIDFNLENSILYIYNTPWYFNKNNHFKYANSVLKIDSFILSNEEQSIGLNGIAGERSFDSLTLVLTQFNLEELNPVIKKWGVQLKGNSNGEFMMDGANTRPVVIADFTIDDLAFNGDSIGDVSLTSVSADGPYKMRVSGKVKNGLINDLLLAGTLDFTPDNNKIDMLFTLKESNIKPFEVFTEGLFSRIDGEADAEITVQGNFLDPDIKGKIKISKGGLYMDYLALPIGFDNVDIVIDENKIDLGTFQITDKHGSKALAGGKILHKNFDNLRFDIFMKNLKNFNVMNLDEFQNDLFFGTAYVDGDVKIKGPLDELYLDINAKTRPKTVISLPLSGSSETSGSDFIEIVDLRADVLPTNFKKLSGISMDFNFDVTEDAEIKLIFDSKFNDVIRATGKGNFKMELNTFGDFYMYGSYTIATGSYNFTALNNIVNKNLKVRPGSKITWNGPPLDAILDLVATTTVKADPTVILPASSVSATGGTNSVAIDCEIYMKDKLFSPQIQLGLDLSKENQSTLFANSDLTSAINQIKSDQDETNKQFINLLVFNSFAPLNSGANNPTSEKALNSFQNSIGEFMTNQLNNWLSQIDPNWELGVDLANTGSAESNQQVIVSLKRKLYNDRIEIGGTYGQAGNSSYDVNVSYKISKDGRLLVRAFNKQGNDAISTNQTTVNTSGLGLYYRKETDYFFPRWRERIYNKKHQPK